MFLKNIDFNKQNFFECDNHFYYPLLSDISSYFANKTILFIAEDENLCWKLLEYQAKQSDKIAFYKKLDCMLFDGLNPSKVLEAQRNAVLYNIICNKHNIIYTSIDAILYKVISNVLLKKNVLSLTNGMDVTLSHLLEKLVCMGYENTNLVLEEGEFSVRGGILDIYSPNNKFPCRIEFFGDTIDDLRFFEIDSQRTVEKIQQIELIPIINIDYKDSVSFFDYFDLTNTITVIEQNFYTIYKQKIEHLYEIFNDNEKNNPSKIKIDEIIHKIDLLNFKTDFVLTNCNTDKNQTFTSIDSSYLMDKNNFVQLKKRKKRKINTFVGINYDDFIIHINFGIGRYKGCEILQINSHNHECAIIEYAGNDKLYIPVENLDLISRYADADSCSILDKLGSNAWNLRKAKVKNKLTHLADAIIKVSAQRMLQKSEIYVSLDDNYYKFCTGFKYIETEDQMNAINDVIDDLQQGILMDRLICGDVGFGKTEIALRTAYLIAAAGKQVAIIAPTTLLVRQHLDLFTERFKNLPFNIKGLSRFTSHKEKNIVKQEIENGTLDIVIGTQSLLDKSINFKKLGLIIIDEEQHFGVKQKEILKESAPNIHVLTLSATPIPRTLQLALTNVKTMSLIATPPINRKPVNSYVINFDKFLLKQALLLEINRGGQVFLITPRLEDINSLISFVQEVVPHCVFAVAHGKLNSINLEKTITDFIAKKYDILIATDIIESGIDIPNANTIIINRANMFGLAQLYQLRGRVGRSNINAYAYIVVDDLTKISISAQKRLKTIKSLDRLGASFSLSANDMEIRGAGNMLGEEQSGNIREIGFELYQKMLTEAIDTLKESKPYHFDWDVKLNLGIEIFIPHEYIEDLNLRIHVYKKISEARTVDELIDITHELADRFGQPPTEMLNLIHVVKIKIICREVFVQKIDAGAKGVQLSFHKSVTIDANKLHEFVEKYRCKIKENYKFWIHLVCEKNSILNKLEHLLSIIKKRIF